MSTLNRLPLELVISVRRKPDNCLFFPLNLSPLASSPEGVTSNLSPSSFRSFYAVRYALCAMPSSNSLVELKGIEPLPADTTVLPITPQPLQKNDFPLPLHVDSVFIPFLNILNLLPLLVATYSTNKLKIWEVIIS